MIKRIQLTPPYYPVLFDPTKCDKDRDINALFFVFTRGLFLCAFKRFNRLGSYDALVPKWSKLTLWMFCNFFIVKLETMADCMHADRILFTL